jgi:hypothetical protein
MPDKRITQLNPLSNPAGEDLFAVVDIDAQETKKTTFADLTGSLQQQGAVAYGLFNQTSSFTPISKSVAETSIINGGVGTLSVPANGFRVGDAYQLVVEGTCTFNNNDTLIFITKYTMSQVPIIWTGSSSFETGSNSIWIL